MSLIDAEGRLFGRVNLVDAAIGAFVVVLIPLAVAAVFLFRPPTPHITSVERAPLTGTEDRAAQGSPLGGKVKLHGSGLRPVLRVEIAGQPALAFIFENPSTADVLFGDLPAGKHDLVLFDGRQEVARAPGAVVIPEKPVAGGTRIRVLGTSMDLSEAAAKELKVGAKFPDDRDPVVEILALGDPEPARFAINGASEVSVPDRWQRRVVMAVRCQVGVLEPRECNMRGFNIERGHVLPVPGGEGGLRVFVDLVLPDRDAAAADMRVRFVGYPSVVNLMHVGDRDREHWMLDGRGAEVTALGAKQQVSGTVSVGVAQEGLGISADLQVNEQMSALDATVRIGLDQSRTGLRYRTDPLRIGGPITFTTPTYVLRGIVLGIDWTAAAKGDGGGTR